MLLKNIKEFGEMSGVVKLSFPVGNSSTGSRGAPQAQAPPPYPVKTSQKKDGHHMGPQVSQVIRPPSEKFLDPLLNPMPED